MLSTTLEHTVGNGLGKVTVSEDCALTTMLILNDPVCKIIPPGSVR